MLSTKVFAQTMERTSIDSGIWAEIGVNGIICNHLDYLDNQPSSTGVGMNVGLRYTKMFNNYIGWDVLKINAQTDLSHFKELLDLQAMTGLRLVSPVIFGHQTAYLTAAIGGSYFTSQNKGNFAWEGGIGINISPKTTIGAFYNDQIIYETHIRFVGVRFSVKI